MSAASWPAERLGAVGGGDGWVGLVSVMVIVLLLGELL
jgi:hypothetical protein